MANNIRGPAFYLVPEEQMERIMAQLDRIEANTRAEAPVGRVMQAQEIADRLGVAKHTVYAWAREGTISSLRIGGRVLFPESAVQELMQKGVSHGSNGNSPVSDDRDRIHVD